MSRPDNAKCLVYIKSERYFIDTFVAILGIIYFGVYKIRKTLSHNMIYFFNSAGIMCGSAARYMVWTAVTLVLN